MHGLRFRVRGVRRLVGCYQIETGFDRGLNDY